MPFDTRCGKIATVEDFVRHGKTYGRSLEFALDGIDAIQRHFCLARDIDITGTWLDRLKPVIGQRFFSFVYGHLWERTASYVQGVETARYYQSLGFGHPPGFGDFPLGFGNLKPVSYGTKDQWNSLADEPDWAKNLTIYTDEQIKNASQLDILRLFYSLLNSRENGEFRFGPPNSVSRAFSSEVNGSLDYGPYRYIYQLDLQDRIYILRPDLRDITLSDGSKGQGLIDPNLIDRAMGGFGDMPRADWTDTLFTAVQSVFGAISPFFSLAQFGINLSGTISDLSKAREQTKLVQDFLGNVAKVERTLASGELTETAISPNTPTDKLIGTIKSPPITSPPIKSPLVQAQAPSLNFIWLLVGLGLILWLRSDD